ncbi:unnamed protein product [Rhodiola kirilowii]
MTRRHHFLLLTYPVHSHINPTLQLANHLLTLGACKVTFATSASACHRITRQLQHEDLSFVEFPDNFIKAFSADGEEQEDPVKLEIRRSCSDTLARVISTSCEDGWPITCSVYTPTVPWMIGVVHQLPVPSVLLWTQPAAVLVIYYHFFFGHRDAIMNLFGQSSSSSSSSIDLPGLPFSLKACDLPTFMRPVNPHPWAIKLFDLQTNWIAAQGNHNVLVNTFEPLEPEALKAVKELNMIPIGPLIRKVCNDELDEKAEGDYVEWLNSKPDASVVYISFGSIWVLSSEQTEELALALLRLGTPFLWIIRTPQEEGKDDDVTQLRCIKELEQLGLIIPWCSQVKVLSHPSVGCFLTHCGWNSTLESLAAGVPMVGIPLWVEQVTNAKLVEEYWKCGVRTGVNENDLVEMDEIIRCLNLVMGDEELRRNANKWKELALKAAAGNGPAYENLCRFVNGLG